MNNSWINFSTLATISSEEYLSSKPFEHYSIIGVFNEDKLKELVKELEAYEYYIEDHDLYQFKRTHDFKNTNNSLIKEFREILFSDSFVREMERITGLNLLRDKGDLHSLKLDQTHYLLCHDDQVQDRAVAFIINLSQDWNEEDGGILELFESDSSGNPRSIAKKIIPEFNQFNFFTVSSKSFHQISEVVSESKSRVSISGWLYKRDRQGEGL